jgi:hypothetical protein
MNTNLLCVSLLALAALVACNDKPANSAHDEHDHDGKGHGHEHGDGKGHDHHGEGHEHGKGHHKHEMKGAVKDFHDVLSPIYHAEKGPGRADKACGALGSFKEKATAVVSEAGEDAGKKSKAEALAKSVEDLDKECAKGKADVEGSLESLHTAFHAVMEG